MNIAFKIVERSANHPIFTVIAGLSSIVSLLWLIYEKLTDGYGITIPLIIFIVSIVLTTVISLYAFTIKPDDRAMRKLANVTFDINRIYSNELNTHFSGEHPNTDISSLIESERNALSAVCQRVSSMFSVLTGKECIVTIKLISTDGPNKMFAHTYIRSIARSERDDRNMQKYDINTGANTAFDIALMPRSGNPPHFHSSNLLKERGYTNQRPDWSRYYKSTIVVPIGFVTRNSKSSTNTLGFLCIDTKSINVLNDDSHVLFMSSFATQMYNFMSLMRSQHSILVDY